MKVLPIRQKPYVVNKKQTVLNKAVDNTSLKASALYVPSFCGKQQIYKNAKDLEYKKQLLINAGISLDNLSNIRSILGGNEIKTILAELNTKPPSYILGTDLHNAKNGIYSANLHMHTENSDGLFTVRELLDKASEYGNYLKKVSGKPFTVAITDHDTTEGIEQAVKIIANKPEKYKNLRVIPGAEITIFQNIANDIVAAPSNPHILVYGINPYELKFKDFIEGTKKIKAEVSHKMFACADKVFEDVYGKSSCFSEDEAKYFSTQFRKSITGMYNHVDRYVKTKIILNEIVLNNDSLKNALKKQFTPYELMKALSDYYKPINGNNYAKTPQTLVTDYLSATTGLDNDKITEILDAEMRTEKVQQFLQTLDKKFSQYKMTVEPKCKYIPDFEILYNSLTNQPDALVGIAHPLDNIKNIQDKSLALKYMQEFYKKFTDIFKEKANFCETYYQSYSEKIKQFIVEPDIPNFMRQLADEYHLYSTGGVDNHRKNLFSRY